MNINPVTIGANIKEARKQKKLSQTELAEMLNKSLRTIQKYESGEIEPSIAMIHEIARCLNTTSTFLMGYSAESICPESMSDVCAFFYYLDKKTELKFDIDIKKPKDNGEWSASITFNGQDAAADYNSTLCLFLEQFQSYREKLETYWADQADYEDWMQKRLAYYAPMGLTDRPIEELDARTRLERRLEALQKDRETSGEE